MATRRMPRRNALWYCSFCTLITGSLLFHQKQSVAQDNVKTKVNDLIESVTEHEVELKVMQRRSKIVRCKQDIFRVAVADPTILDFVAFGTREVEIIGKTIGSTNMTLWMGEQDNPQILSILITVERDDAPENTRILEYGELQDLVNEMFPQSKIQLIPIADKIIARGQARDEKELLQILSILGKNLSNNGSSRQAFQAGAVAEPFAKDNVNDETTSLINMITVPGVKQVLLKVRIAELERTGGRNLGVNFDFSVGDFLFNSALTAGGNAMLTGTFNSDSFNLVLQALETNGTAKILAEPNLTVLSGQNASFLAGGEFAVPTVVGVGGAQAATTSFKGFGTQLNFTPTVLDRDRIRLNVTPTFSTINPQNGVQGIPGLDTRTVSTTVDLREGQVLAIAGLLQEQQRGDASRVPLFGRIPVVKTLFENKSISREETELIIVVSPELVSPLEAENAPTILPGMEVTEPDDIEFFIHGNIEGRPGAHHRSTVWPIYRNRLKRCGRDGRAYHLQSEGYYINGPHGFSN